MIPKSQGVMVLGMHRGGTSLVAELVARWGAFGDEGTMLAADANNPHGYWEHAPLVHLNDELLSAVDARWNVPPRDTDKPLLEALAQDSDFRNRALQLLREMEAGERPWFWKDPRLSILLPFWKQIWGGIAYIVPIRDPSDIALSLKSRDGFSTLTSFLLWQRYMSEILADREIRSTALFISYEDLLSNQIRACSRLCRFLDERFEIHPPDRDPRPETMAAAIVPELRRSRSACLFSQTPFATAAQKALYQSILHHTQEVTKEPLAPSGLDSSWRERLAVADLHQPKASAGDRCQVFWRNPSYQYDERRSTSAMIEAQGVMQSIHLALPPGNNGDSLALRLDLSQRPGLAHLTGLVVKDAASDVVWEWDGQPESIQELPRNQIQLWAGTMSPGGCTLQLNGDDPWIELALDDSQSAALASGGTVEVACSYFSTMEALLQLNAQMMNEIAEFRIRLQRLSPAVP